MKKIYNSRIVEVLAKKYAITPRYVRYCLKGDRNPVYADELKKEYQRLLKKVDKALGSD